MACTTHGADCGEHTSYCPDPCRHDACNREPSTTGEYVLWGIHPRYAHGAAVKLAIGTLRDCRAEARYRERDGGWLLGTYAKGDEPVGLRLRAEAA